MPKKLSVEEKMEKALVTGEWNLDYLYRGEFRQLPKDLREEVNTYLQQRRRRLKGTTYWHIRKPVSKVHATSFVEAIEKLIELKGRPLATVMKEMEGKGVSPEGLLETVEPRPPLPKDQLKGEAVEEQAEELVESEGELVVILGEPGEPQEIDWKEEPSLDIKVVEEPPQSPRRPLPAHILEMVP